MKGPKPVLSALHLPSAALEVMASLGAHLELNGSGRLVRVVARHVRLSRPSKLALEKRNQRFPKIKMYHSHVIAIDGQWRRPRACPVASFAPWAPGQMEARADTAEVDLTGASPCSKSGFLWLILKNEYFSVWVLITIFGSVSNYSNLRSRNLINFGWLCRVYSNTVFEQFLRVGPKLRYSSRDWPFKAIYNVVFMNIPKNSRDATQLEEKTPNLSS